MSKTLCTTCNLKIDMRSVIYCSSCNQPLHKTCAITKNNTLCDKCFINAPRKDARKLQYTLPKVIRRSHIELYLSCPYSFYLQVIRGNEAKPTIQIQVGIDLHWIFEKHQLTPMDKQSMIYYFDDAFKHYTDELFGNVDKDEMYQRAMKCIDEFYDTALSTSPLAIEEKIIFPIAEGMPKVSITMDRIDEYEGSLYMKDWKTGRVMSGKKLTTDLQAPLYIHAVQQKYKMPVQEFRFFYLNEGKERVFERVNGDEYVCHVKKNSYTISIREALGRVNSAFSRMKNGDFNIPVDKKSMAFTCKMCSMREQGLCAGAETESWHQIHRKRQEDKKRELVGV